MKKTREILKAVGNRFLRAVDHVYDMRICRQDLSEYIPSLFRDDKKGVGMTGTQATHYLILKKIFAEVEIKETDSFLDVGCGMGRVLAYCVKEKFPCLINGVEINEVPGKIAASWSGRYKNVYVTIGDAFQLDFNEYTVLFLGRPFLPKTFVEFITLIESQLIHPITFIYWVDQQSGHYLLHRTGWTMRKRDVIREMYGFPLQMGPQGYSIWKYVPQDIKEG